MIVLILNDIEILFNIDVLIWINNKFIGISTFINLE